MTNLFFNPLQMKKVFLSLLVLVVGFGSASTLFAVEVDSIYLNETASEKLDSVSDLITMTPLSQRIADDEAELAAGKVYQVNPFRNIQRMLRSIAVGPDTPTKSIDFLNAYIDDAIYRLNLTGKIRVYGESREVMGYFLSNKNFLFGGFK